jgi:1-acylglycerone phosphate reductase
MLDENLRIEMAPLGVKVLTVVAGSVATTFGDNNKSDSLPKGSRYEPVKKEFDRLATWDNGTERMSTEVFAKRVVDDILGGVTGRTYRGTQASVARYSSTGLPMFVIVSGPEVKMRL